MVPVVTAIVAALLAGAAALYRERRLELQRLLVASRVMHDAFEQAASHVDVFLRRFSGEDGSSEPWNKAVLAQSTDLLELREVWAEHRNVLSGHLTLGQWDTLSGAVILYAGLKATLRSPSSESEATSLSELGLTSMPEVRDHLRAAFRTLDPYCERAGFLRNPGHNAAVAASKSARSSTNVPPAT